MCQCICEVLWYFVHVGWCLELISWFAKWNSSLFQSRKWCRHFFCSARYMLLPTKLIYILVSPFDPIFLFLRQPHYKPDPFYLNWPFVWIFYLSWALEFVMNLLKAKWRYGWIFEWKYKEGERGNVWKKVWELLVGSWKKTKKRKSKSRKRKNI